MSQIINIDPQCADELGMKLLLICFAILVGHAVFAETRSATICYFSLNNEKEFQNTKALADKLNQQTGHNIQVKEYLSFGAEPNAAFERMVASGAKCDGLVISGHHYGAWEGKRSHGTLKLDFLEKLSCNPKYKDWFKNINSLHLQGCRTLGVGTITPELEDRPEFSADANTSRVNRVAEVDSIEQGVYDMNHEFTNTLDQDNPLSSRYLRTFPRATTFGWTKSAPGENSKSELSLIYHIAHMAQVNNYHQRDVIVNPMRDLTNTDAAELANAVLDMLQKPDWKNCENTSIRAWKNHGTPIRNKGYGYNNPDLNALPSYETTNDASMIQAKEIGCKFKNAKTQKERREALNLILNDRKLIAANFNSLIELSSDPAMSTSDKNEMLSLMRNSERLKSFIGDKINSKQAGLFAKIDYYTFFKKLHGKSGSAESIIANESFKYLLKPYPPNENSIEYQDLVDYNRTLTDALAKNQFVDRAFMERLKRDQSEMGKDMYRALYNKIRIIPAYRGLASELK